MLLHDITVTRLSVGDPGSNMSTSVSALQPLLRLRNAQQLHLKGNSRKFGFLLLWSTIKGARLNLEDAENQLEATASVGGSGSDVCCVPWGHHLRAIACANF